MNNNFSYSYSEQNFLILIISLLAFIFLKIFADEKIKRKKLFNVFLILNIAAIIYQIIIHIIYFFSIINLRYLDNFSFNDIASCAMVNFILQIIPIIIVVLGLFSLIISFDLFPIRKKEQN